MSDEQHMTRVDLQKLHDNLVTLATLSADYALFIKTGLDDENLINEDWAETFVEKMMYLNTASAAMMTDMYGEQATTTIIETLEGAMDNGLPQ